MVHPWNRLHYSLPFHQLLVLVGMPTIALPTQPWMCMLSKMHCVACQQWQSNGVHGVLLVRLVPLPITYAFSYSF